MNLVKSTSTLLALFLVGTVVAFTPTRHPFQAAVGRIAIPGATRIRPDGLPLRYRALDEQDDDSAMLQVQTRTPPGYDPRKAVGESEFPTAPGGDDAPGRRRLPRTAMNTRLILALLLNQGLVLAVASTLAGAALFATSGGLAAFGNLNELLRWTGTGPDVWDLTITGERLLWGIGGALPLLVLNAVWESSDDRRLANINFSTIAMVMTLFGRRTALPDEFRPASWKGQTLPTTTGGQVALQSLVLSLVTGICEETIFRRELPAVLRSFGADPVSAMIGQAALFGLGHVQPTAKAADNTVVASLQTVNGLGFGLIYALSGGDLVPCMIAHACYDFVVFFQTWTRANDQLEYAERWYKEPLPAGTEQKVRRILQAAQKDPSVLLPRIKRLFYVFDFDQNQSLSLSEVRKGVAYLAMERAGTPPPQPEVDQAFWEVVAQHESDARDDRLDLVDFLRVYSKLADGNRQRLASAQS
jgi:membrane protease YdiL (CAAX protease family)